MEKVVVCGAGEFSELIDNLMAYEKDYEIIAYGDDDPVKAGSNRDGKPILSMEFLFKLAKDEACTKAIIAIGNNQIRGEKYQLFKEKGFEFINLTHPKALIDTRVETGDNVVIEMGTAIHTKSVIGNNVFLGGDALIGHHNILGDHVLVGGNASFGGSVKVEDYSTIGVGSSLKPGISIGKNSIVGVGSAVIKDVPDNVIVAGVPAKIIGKVD